MSPSGSAARSRSSTRLPRRRSARSRCRPRPSRCRPTIPRRDEVYTANSNSDTVSVINTRTDAAVATIDVSLASGAREGAMPDGLTVSPDGKRLYVALAGENALAVIDVARRRVIGFIPTAWYPVDVEITA